MNSLRRMLFPSTWAEDTQGNLIGEVEITSPEMAQKYAAQCQDEAVSIWNEPKANWEVIIASEKGNVDSLEVEARRVTQGPFASSGLLLTRASHTISTSLSAETIYQLLISPEGFAMIDPVSDPEDFEKYLERYDYPPAAAAGGGSDGSASGRLEVAEAHAQLLPCMATRDFCVLNCFNHSKRLFTSKSIVHAKLPGSSQYYQPPPQVDQPSSSSSFTTTNSTTRGGGAVVRALNTFAFRVERSGENQVSLDWINWIDLALPSPSLMNWIACKQTFPHIIGKLQLKLVEMEARKQE